MSKSAAEFNLIRLVPYLIWLGSDKHGVATKQNNDTSSGAYGSSIRK